MNTVQYTIRGIPSDLDKMIRKRAKREGKSFNKTVVDILQKNITLAQASSSAKDIFERARTEHILDDGFFDAIEAQSQIDKKLWK